MAIDYNKKMQFPANDDYVARITEAEFVESKRSGNPMIHYTMEVVSPDTRTIDGKEVNIAGVQIEQYATVTVMDGADVDTEGTDNVRERLKELLAKLEIETSNFDYQNPPVEKFKGLVVLCALGADTDSMRKAPTPEQLAKGQKEGDVMMNPITKKAIVFYKPKVIEIFGIAPESVAKGAKANKGW